MKQKHIQVDEAALEQTVLLCQKEQERYIQKNCTSILQLILRYMWLDFRFYMILSILGLFTSILLILLDTVNAQIYTAIYFFTLGITALYEYYKSRHYQMLDIVSPVYLNPCRAFLIRTAGIALNGLVIYTQYIRYMISNPLVMLIIFIVSGLTLFNMQQINKGMSDTERRQQKWSCL